MYYPFVFILLERNRCSLCSVDLMRSGRPITCQQLTTLLSNLQLHFVPLSLVLRSVPLLSPLLIQASLLYTPFFFSLILFLPGFICQIILCGNCPPFTHCTLASCRTVCLCACVFVCVCGGLRQGIDRSHSWVNSAYAPGGSRSVLRRNPNSSCELKQVPNPSSSFSPSLPHHLHPAPPLINSRGSFPTSDLKGFVRFCVPLPLLAVSYLSVSRFILSPPTNRPELLCSSDIISVRGSSEFLPEFTEFSVQPFISIHPFSHHFVLISVFTSPPLHVRQTTAAAIACLPIWTAWPCFQFPQGRLQRR